MLSVHSTELLLKAQSLRTLCFLPFCEKVWGERICCAQSLSNCHLRQILSCSFCMCFSFLLEAVELAKPGEIIIPLRMQYFSLVGTWRAAFQKYLSFLCIWYLLCCAGLWLRSQISLSCYPTVLKNLLKCGKTITPEVKCQQVVSEMSNEVLFTWII